jgi:mRNA-degrading endonuclease RelE of RelBE toxin-antitoxin system
MRGRPVVVVEVPPFADRAGRVWTDDEREQFTDFIARNPEAGNVIPGTGGLRKVRWKQRARGRRGGTRVIYYFHDDTAPLFLLTVHAKSQKADLTHSERKRMTALTATVKAMIRGKGPMA